jgi:integrase
MRRNPAAGLRIKTHFPLPERMEVFSPQEVFMLIRRPLEERERIKRSDFPTEHAYLNAVYTLGMQHLMMELLFSTGIRPCELVRAECSDLDEVYIPA